MRLSAKKHRQRIITTGFAALALLVLSACTTPPTTISARPPEAVETPSLPRGNAPLRPLTKDVAPASSVPAAATVAGTTRTTEEDSRPVAAPHIYSESSASYYAPRFEGRRTASGERYDPKRMTAATRDFPLQSWLKVINPANGREVTVRINDRTGKRKTPLIDLSRAAAKKLGFFGQGKIHVHVIPTSPQR